jgi:hypothetical protein
MVSEYTGHDQETVSDYFGWFQQLVCSSLDGESQIIGGEGIIVEIDETKIAKRKYNRGQHIEGAWVLGGVERTDEKKLFLVEVPDRTAETLLTVLSRHLRIGTIVYSDLWRGYIRLTDRLHLEHQSVNHSYHFVDPVTGVHTNTIEATWCALKKSIPITRRTRGKVCGHLIEFIWRRLNQNDLWTAFISALRDVEFTN